MRIEATAPTLQARDHLPGEGTEHRKDLLASPAAPADGDDIISARPATQKSATNETLTQRPLRFPGIHSAMLLCIFRFSGPLGPETFSP
jgi:hypothetical protein